MARLTTRERWAFAPYAIEERGERNVPLIYLKTARWNTIRGSTGYFVNIPTRPSQYYPVEFNHVYLCWCEITWNAPEGLWTVDRPAGPDYRCDIFEDEVRTTGNVGPIDGQAPPPTPRTPTPSTDSQGGDQNSEGSEETIESGHPGNTTEEEGLANLAESIHINSPAMATMIQEQPVEVINEGTGHRARRIVNIVDDEAAIVTLPPNVSLDVGFDAR